MAIAIFIKYKEGIYKVIGILPFIFALLLSILSSITKLLFPPIEKCFDNTITLHIFYSWSAYFPLLLQIFLILVIMLNSVLLANTTEEKIFSFLLISAAFAARMVVSFSSTIYTSGMRTHNTTYFIFMWILFEDLYKKYSNC